MTLGKPTRAVKHESLLLIRQQKCRIGVRAP
jgi:hypothetical protein